MKIKILDNKFIYFVFICICFEFPYFDTFIVFNKVFDVAKILLIILLFILFIRNEKTVSKDIICIFLYTFIIIIATILNDYGNLKSAISMSIKILSISMLTKMCMKRNPKKYIHSALFVLESMVLINFLTILIFPNGLYSTIYQKQNFFLGYDNRHIIFILPMLCLRTICDYTEKNKLTKHFWIDLLISISSVFIRFSATSVIGMFIFLIYILLFNILKSNKFINFKNIYIGNLILFFSVIIVRIQERFSYFIDMVLKKDLTFTGRTIIWDNTLEYIKNKPLLGYGIESYEIRGLKNNSLTAIFAHNQILEIIYSGGFILYGIYTYLMVNIAKEFKKYKKDYRVKILSVFFCSLFTMMLTEVYNNPTIFMMYIIASNIGMLIECKN